MLDSARESAENTIVKIEQYGIDASRNNPRVQQFESRAISILDKVAEKIGNGFEKT